MLLPELAQFGRPAKKVTISPATTHGNIRVHINEASRRVLQNETQCDTVSYKRSGSASDFLALHSDNGPYVIEGPIYTLRFSAIQGMGAITVKFE